MTDTNVKLCRICLIKKPLHEFTFQLTHGPISSGHYLTKCKACSSAHLREKRQKNRQLGLCDCGRELTGLFEHCDFCRKSRKRTPEFAEHRHNLYEKNKERDAPVGKAYREKLRLEILHAYCGEHLHCQCPGGCATTEPDFLTIDHIDGGGHQHRKKIGNFYSWLKRNRFPKGFRVLCFCCNGSRGIRGYCPHERKAATRAALTLAVNHQ